MFKLGDSTCEGRLKYRTYEHTGQIRLDLFVRAFELPKKFEELKESLRTLGYTLEEDGEDFFP